MGPPYPFSKSVSAAGTLALGAAGLYHAAVRRLLRRTFERLSAGEWQAVLGQASEDVHHVFAGDHALGGERHSRAAMGRWFERVYRLVPLDMEVRSVASSGWPWDTVAAVEWTDRVRPAAGAPYVQHGTHWLRIRWGRVTEIRAYLDTQKVEQAMRAMVEAGIDEAGAPPITD
jgi:ketosteroid isomerase-like protein